MNPGDTLVVQFKNDSYTSFIEYCFSAGLISGVHVKIIGENPKKYILFLYAVNSVNLEKKLKEFGGEVVF